MITTLALKRSFERVPGYDCRTACVHTVKGQHGIHPEEWHYAIVAEDYAVHLVVNSGEYPSTANVPKERPQGVSLNAHAAFPLDEEVLRWGKGRFSPCHLLPGGVCVSAGYWYGQARVLYEQHGACEGGPEQSEAFWQALEVFAKKQYEDAQSMRVDRHLARCSHCDGRGVIAKGEGEKP